MTTSPPSLCVLAFNALRRKQTEQISSESEYRGEAQFPACHQDDTGRNESTFLRSDGCPCPYTYPGIKVIPAECGGFGLGTTDSIPANTLVTTTLPYEGDNLNTQEDPLLTPNGMHVFARKDDMIRFKEWCQKDPRFGKPESIENILDESRLYIVECGTVDLIYKDQGKRASKRIKCGNRIQSPYDFQQRYGNDDGFSFPTVGWCICVVGYCPTKDYDPSKGEIPYGTSRNAMAYINSGQMPDGDISNCEFVSHHDTKRVTEDVYAFEKGQLIRLAFFSCPVVSVRVQTLRNIHPGEELTVSYPYENDEDALTGSSETALQSNDNGECQIVRCGDNKDFPIILD